MGLQRSLHRRHDPGARCGVGVLEQPLAEPGRLEEVDGVGHVSTQPQRLHDRLDGDIDEPGSVQTAAARCRSPSENGPGLPGLPGGGRGMCWAWAAALLSTVIHSLFATGCQHTKAIRPPGRRPRTMLANAAVGSLKNITPKRLIATSKPCGARRCVCASPCSKRTLVRPSCRASLFGPLQQGRAMSTPSARPSSAARAAVHVVDPVPQLMSRTRSVRATAAASRTGEGRAHALVAVFVDQPVVGFRAVPVLVLVLGLVVVGSALWFHDSHPTPSSILKSTWVTNMGDGHLTIGELAKGTGVATGLALLRGTRPAPSTRQGLGSAALPGVSGRARRERSRCFKTRGSHSASPRRCLRHTHKPARAGAACPPQARRPRRADRQGPDREGSHHPRPGLPPRRLHHLPQIRQHRRRPPRRQTLAGSPPTLIWSPTNRRVFGPAGRRCKGLVPEYRTGRPGRLLDAARRTEVGPW